MKHTNRLIDALLVDIRAQDEKIFKKYKETYILTGAQPLIERIPERDTDRLIEKMFAMIQSTYHRDSIIYILTRRSRRNAAPPCRFFHSANAFRAAAFHTRFPTNNPSRPVCVKYFDKL